MIDPNDSLPPLSEEWLIEIQRRSAEFDAGLAQPIPWKQVRTDALRRLGLTERDDPPIDF